jgi:hypothetical protein
MPNEAVGVGFAAGHKGHGAAGEAGRSPEAVEPQRLKASSVRRLRDRAPCGEQRDEKRAIAASRSYWSSHRRTPGDERLEAPGGMRDGGGEAEAFRSPRSG